MTKTIEETVENYVASLPKAMLMYKKYLMKDRKFNEDYAIDKAIDYGRKMLAAGIGTTFTLDEGEAIFTEMKGISGALIQLCESYRKN